VLFIFLACHLWLWLRWNKSLANNFILVFYLHFKISKSGTKQTVKGLHQHLFNIPNPRQKHFRAGERFNIYASKIQLFWKHSQLPANNIERKRDKLSD
jgi:hypothetical protein